MQGLTFTDPQTMGCRGRRYIVHFSTHEKNHDYRDKYDALEWRYLILIISYRITNVDNDGNFTV